MSGKINKRILAFALLCWTPFGATAQKDADSFEMFLMHRDVNIMENVLDGLIYWQFGRTSIQPFGQTQGIYVPKVGVILKVPSSFYDVNYFFDASKGGQGDEPVKTHLERLKNTAVEFLGDYADAGRRLQKDERVIVLYEAEPTIVQLFGNRFDQRTLRVFSSGFQLSAKQGDIARFRSQSIDNEEFRQVVNYSDLTASRENAENLAQIAGGFEETLASEDGERFVIRGNVSNLYLDDFGVLFLVNTIHAQVRRPGFVVQIEEIRKFNEFVNNRMREIMLRPRGSADSQTAGFQINFFQEFPVDQSEYIPKVKQAYETFENRIASYLIEQCERFPKLSDNQKIVVAASVKSNIAAIPKRVVFQLKKSDADAWLAENISREEALQRVTISRYNSR